jgi:hypothetical protein
MIESFLFKNERPFIREEIYISFYLTLIKNAPTAFKYSSAFSFITKFQFPSIEFLLILPSIVEST